MKSKFEIRKDEHGYGDVLILKSDWSDSVYDYMIKKRIIALRLSDSAGFSGKDLSFLHKLTFLKSLELYCWEAKDIKNIESLSQLEVLSVQFLSNKKLDFSAFKNLRIAMFTWKEGLASILKLESIEHLNIENYGCSNLEPIAHMGKLKKLYLTSRKLETLKGIENLKSLEVLDLYNCQKLVSTAGIEQCKKLGEIEIEACNKLNA